MDLQVPGVVPDPVVPEVYITWQTEDDFLSSFDIEHRWSAENHIDGV